MSRRTVEIKIIFLNVLSVIGLAIGQTERPLLEYRVLAVPQRQRKTQTLLIVADTGETILAPVIGARAGLIVTEVVPRVSVLAIVLTHRAPLALAEVRPPLPPRHLLFSRLVQTHRFRRCCSIRRWFVGHCGLLLHLIRRDSYSRDRRPLV